jgi:molecular chaperone IbpA
MTTPAFSNFIFGPAYKDVEKFFVGYDQQFNRMAKFHDDLAKNVPNYPPYNIKKTGENTYAIELAVAGFGKQDIEIEFADDVLIVKGNTSEDNNDYLFKGIAARNFTRTFALNEQIEIKDAELFNGMLKIVLERIIPEHKKPKKIEVKDANEPTSSNGKKSKKELLLEDTNAIN